MADHYHHTSCTMAFYSPYSVRHGAMLSRNMILQQIARGDYAVPPYIIDNYYANSYEFIASLFLLMFYVDKIYYQ